jgi:hypothetical protein
MMATTAVPHRLGDYAARRQAAEEVELSQRAGGVTAASSWEENNNPTNGLIVHRCSSMAEAEAYLAWRARRQLAALAAGDRQSSASMLEIL